ncbi:MAG: hypothetical protein IPN42_03300 [Methylococcaceae bacterium]|nr:hypothetical protein [Methylococcaceae bacterium]
MTSELESIYIELVEDGVSKYSKIQARRTSENFFHITSEPLPEHIGSFKAGDYVRCAWRYFGAGFDGGIVAIMQAKSKLPLFSIGDKVLVSEHSGWQCNFLGTVVSNPEPSQTNLGQETLYWVQFEKPQKDRSENEEYIKAQISNAYLKCA